MFTKRKILGSLLLASVVLPLLLSAGCGGPAESSGEAKTGPVAAGGEDGLLAWQPLAKRSAASDTLFESLTAEATGVDMVNPLDLDEPKKFLYNSPFASGGVCIGDVDGDGNADLFCTNGPGGNRLYLQREAWKFVDATKQAQVDGGDAWGAGATMVDIDNDGDLDIYVANYDAANQLFVNDGQARFTERASQYGLDAIDACLMPAFCDFDNDGDLDLYLLTNQYFRPGGKPPQPPVEKVDGQYRVKPEYQKYYALQKTGPRRWEADTTGRPDYLYRNNGDGTFEDVTSTAGIAGAGFGLSVVWWDYDGDGHTDIYVANDYSSPDRLYRNNGDGTFRNVAGEALPFSPWFSMGAEAADFNNDGRLDLMTTDMAATTHYKAKVSMGDMGDKLASIEDHRPLQAMRNCLFINQGIERFVEKAFMAHVAQTDWTWGVRAGDYDNDGLTDLVFTNGAARHFNHSDVRVSETDLIGHNAWDYFEDMPKLAEQNFAFRNHGGADFENASKAWGFDHVGVSSAVAHGDIDADGDLDLVVVNLDEPVSLYRNNSPDSHRVVVGLRGTASNRFGIGAVVTLRTASGQQMRQLSPMTGYMSSSEPVLHFGLGDDETIEELVVQWPSGREQRFDDLKSDRRYTIIEPDESAPVRKKTTPAPRQFEEVAYNRGLLDPHQERPFDDYARQPLLPGKLSQLGPGVAWGDADGDGDDDLAIGGAAGQATLVYINQQQRGFDRLVDGPWKSDLDCEDMGLLWIDADGDGDLDLFVASGGVECSPGDDVLRNRLYLNQGDGTFENAPRGALPDTAESSSACAAADFDGDGDLDLFVGSRSIAGRYPETPNSQLLRNDDGTFVDVTDRLAPELRKAGLVSGAVWSDADNDGRPDLLLALEWGPIKLYHNDGGKLVDATVSAGLAERLGWWNSIAPGDFDGDGHIDYVVMNVGHNTKYKHPTASKPAMLFYGDMEGNGRKRLVEAKPGDDGILPVRGRSCSSLAMPFIAQKFETFNDFALAGLTDIYTQKCLDDALQLAANCFESGVLMNDGAGRFTFHPLPSAVQMSPGYGIAVADFNADGRTDIFAAQNMNTREPETGLWNSGVGVLLLGEGQGEFREAAVAETGLIVAGDAKGLAVGDLDQNGWPDFVVGQNNDLPLAYQNRGVPNRRSVAIRLHATRANPTAAGARVTAHLSDETHQTAELAAGSGYMSQSAPLVFVSMPAETTIERIEVRWPNGHISNHEDALTGPVVTIQEKE